MWDVFNRMRLPGGSKELPASIHVFWTWEDYTKLASKAGGQQSRAITAEEKLFFEEVMYNLREDGIDVIITMISNGKESTEAARHVYAEAQLWLEGV